MSNRKYLCFECQLAFRRDANSSKPVKCSQCAGYCVNIGYKIPVPPKNKPKEWEALKTQLANEEKELVDSRKFTNIKKKHSLEKELEKLEALPENSGRKSLIKKLNQRLERVNA